MKRAIAAVAYLLFFCALVHADDINIIPKPNSITPHDGYFELSRKTELIVSKEGDRELADVFNAYLQQNFGFKLKIRPKASGRANAVSLSGLVPDMELPKGGYRLGVAKNKVDIFATDQAGRFYAIQSLIQLLPATKADKLKIPAVEISDAPRFGYRGMHLDVSRHFWPVSFVKKYIDLMSQYKFNTFHWHLTDDQGWRIEIKKYPRLTEIGSKRPESVKEKNLQPYIGDGVPVEGFYTQDEVRDVVAYAKARFVTVIPEIELPGHSSAAWAAYPELGCKQDYKYKVQTTWGIFKEVYCPTEKTFQFLEGVLSEVIELFPDSPYIHIGGDEVLKDMWKESPEVKELMAREGLKDEPEVQSYFVRRMEKFINSKGKKIIGWDEILEGGLAPNATVMSWRGMKGGIEAAKAHHDVIMTPTDFAYFDYGQGDPAYEPINIGNYVTLQKVYSFDPVPKELSPEEAQYILGGQGNVWTEYIQTPEKVEYMVFPRMLALSEVLWTKPENKDYADFQRRSAANFARLDKQNVNYRIPEPAGLENRVLAGDSTEMLLTAPIGGSKIYYTLDGSEPSDLSALYEKPITVSLEPNERKDLKTIVVLPSGRKSSVYSATLLRRAYAEPVDAAKLFERKEKRPGVTYALSLSAADGTVNVTSGERAGIGLLPLFGSAVPKVPFTAAFDGYIIVPADGVYEFQTESNWDVETGVADQILINAKGTKDRTMRSAVVPLKAGLHRIHLAYSNREGDAFFRVRWGIKGQGLRVIGGGDLVH